MTQEHTKSEYLSVKFLHLRHEVIQLFGQALRIGHQERLANGHVQRPYDMVQCLPNAGIEGRHPNGSCAIISQLLVEEGLACAECVA